MMTLVTGGCKNGKSSYAQDLACELAKKEGSAPIYFATMIPHDSEDEARIQKHRTDRKNLGFETIEIGRNFSQIVEKLEPGRVILFDSLTALLANEFFEGRTDFSIQKMQEDAVQIIERIEKSLEKLIQKENSVVFVSDTIFCDIKYDEITELYRRNLAKLEQFVAKRCEKVVEMELGVKNEKLKGECSGSMAFTETRANEASQTFTQVSSATPLIPNCCLIVGGCYQGKTALAKEKFSLSDEEVFVCTEDSEPDFSKRCLSHFENYIAYCIKNSLQPKTSFSDSKIIICDDIFCGVVPIDAFQRKLREETGLTLQKIAKNAELYRVFCGKAQKI